MSPVEALLDHPAEEPPGGSSGARSMFALCSTRGLVLWSDGPHIGVGHPLHAAFAIDSRDKVDSLLRRAATGVGHAMLQTNTGELVESFCASDGEIVLLVAGTTLGDVRTRCEDAPAALDLAARIARAAVPDDLTIDLWTELAGVNNELTTAQRELARTNAELRRLNDEKNELLGMAAHDLRSPLAAVLAYTAFLREDAASLSADQREMIRRIVVNVDAMLALVEDVLDFSAIESGTVRLEPAAFPVAALLQDTAEICRLTAERKRISINVDAADTLPLLVADRRRVGQVLQNLVSNAIKFSPHHSTVLVEAKVRDAAAMQISVRDHGPGMTAEQRRALFRPFHRVGSRPTGGEKSTGLGLAIVQRIVHAHGGTVAVESEPGAGSTFAVTLPLLSAS